MMCCNSYEVIISLKIGTRGKLLSWYRHGVIREALFPHKRSTNALCRTVSCTSAKAAVPCSGHPLTEGRPLTAHPSLNVADQSTPLKHAPLCGSASENYLCIACISENSNWMNTKIYAARLRDEYIILQRVFLKIHSMYYSEYVNAIQATHVLRTMYVECNRNNKSNV